jgi:hypothetical protein
LSAAIASIRSTRRPFGRSLYVGGNRDRRLKFKGSLTEEAGIVN